jgi:ABC-2 type transport system permease protein
MNIFIRELKSNFKSLIIWGVIVGILVTIGIAKFSAYEGNPEMAAIMDNMPEPMLEAFSMNAFNLTTIEGFFGVMFTFFALLVSIAAAMWGSEIISKEERDKTVEFSLTLPVPRNRLVTAKLLAAVVNCIGLLAITYVVSFYSVAQYEPDADFYRFLNLSMVALFILQMVFLAIGILLGCAMKQHKRAGSTAVSILLVTYFLSIVSGLSEDYEFLKYFSPFKYFDPADLLHKSEIDLTFVWISAGIIVVALVAGYVSYSRRDLYI